MAASAGLGKELVVAAVCLRCCNSSEAVKLAGERCWQSKADENRELRAVLIQMGGTVGASW